jgi:hypothetical protein
VHRRAVAEQAQLGLARVSSTTCNSSTTVRESSSTTPARTCSSLHCVSPLIATPSIDSSLPAGGAQIRTAAPCLPESSSGLRLISGVARPALRSPLGLRKIGS